MNDGKVVEGGRCGEMRGDAHVLIPYGRPRRAAVDIPQTYLHPGLHLSGFERCHGPRPLMSAHLRQLELSSRQHVGEGALAAL